MNGQTDVTDARAAQVIGATTFASGLGLVVAPRLSLRLMGAATSSPAPLLFRVVGMFMTVAGGTLLDGPREPVVLRWAIAQKVGAVAGVGLGVARGDYRPRALGVAAFDAVSAVLLAGALPRARRRSTIGPP